MIGRYAWRGGGDHVRIEGAGLPIQLLVLPALFDEANRMRRFTVELMRRLAARGIGTRLPDLPGTGESERDLSEVALDDWIDAAAAAAPAGTRIVAIRGGALLAAAAAPCWCLAPAPGANLVRDVERAALVARQPAGYPRALLDAVARLAPPAQARTVALSDGVTADRVVAGALLWRRAEPDEDATLADLLADDIHSWTHTCATS